MKKTFKLISVIMVMMMMSGAALAWDAEDHVKMAPDGKGDLIFYPFYVASAGGWQTKIVVTNTHPNLSCVAKVVVRSALYSQELRDWLIYLSPRDVWVGYLRHNGTNPIIISTDDSQLVNTNPTFATETAPATISLGTPTCAGDTNEIGYITIVQCWAEDLYQTATAAIAGNITAEKPGTLDYTSTDGTAGDADGVDKAYIYQIYNVRGATNYPNTTPQNILASYAEIGNASTGQLGTIRGNMFKDFDCTQPLTISDSSDIVGATYRNSLGELEAAMAKNNLAFEYVNDQASGDYSLHILTFPTKLSIVNGIHRAAPVGGGCTYYNGYHSNPNTDWTVAPNNVLFPVEYSPFWWYRNPATVGIQCVTLTGGFYDTAENTTTAPGQIWSPVTAQQPNSICAEVNYNLSYQWNSLFTEGWRNYNITDVANRSTTGTDFSPLVRGLQDGNDGRTYTYFGAPVLAQNITLHSGALAVMEAAYDSGVVTVSDQNGLNTQTYNYYQVANVPYAADLTDEADYDDPNNAADNADVTDANEDQDPNANVPDGDDLF